MSATILCNLPTVFFVGGDPTIGRSLRKLTQPREIGLESFLQADAMLGQCDPTRPGCIVVDLDLSGVSLASFFRTLAHEQIHLPVVVLSSEADAAAAVQAMKAGAHDFVSKPCDDLRLGAALNEAFAWDAEHRDDIVACFKIRRRMRRLTTSEAEVLQLIVAGCSNGEAAAALGRSVRTVEVRRARLMQKMKAKGVADLVRMALADRAFGPCKRAGAILRP